MAHASFFKPIYMYSPLKLFYSNHIHDRMNDIGVQRYYNVFIQWLYNFLRAAGYMYTTRERERKRVYSSFAKYDRND